MSQKIQSVKIRHFSGMETKLNATDQPPGTLRFADGVSTVPQGALSFGPNWQTAWARTTLAADINAALVAQGLSTGLVHFVRISRNGSDGQHIFLIAWYLQTSSVGTPMGIFHVKGIGDPLFSQSGASLVTSGAAVYINKSAQQRWYASYIQNEIWLGNGIDANLVSTTSVPLAALGPTTAPTDAQDPSQVVFPPCTCWLPGSENQVYGAGNTTYPLRIWCSEIPSINYPLNRGLKTSAYSYLDLQVNATSITGLSSFGRNLIVHLNVGPPMIIEGYRGSAGGWKLQQSPTKANASAINPNCTRDTKLSSFYFGSDLEVYKLPTFRGSIVDRGYDASTWRDEEIVTKKSSGDWNSQAAKPVNGTNYFLIYDEKNGRTWIWVVMSAGAQEGIYCWDERTGAMTGPWRYPDFLAGCQLRDSNLNGCIAAGITSDGAFLYADLAAIGDFTLPDYTTALPAGCAELTTAPTPNPGIPYVGVSADGQSFKMVLNGQTLSLATPWSAWAVGDVTCTRFYSNARIAVIEFAECDAGSPALQKEFVALRTIWNRNSCAYIGVYSDSGGRLAGGWRGLCYPSIDWIAAIGGQSSTVRIRIIAVTFNGTNALLSGANIEYLPGVEN